MTGSPQRIGIALVEQEGRYLVGIRPEGVPLAGMAEFPGGKCTPDESPADCAARECREETGLVVEPVESLLTVTHQYAHGRVELHFVKCRLADPGTARDEHQGFRWAPANELRSLKFPEANDAVIQMLSPESSEKTWPERHEDTKKRTE